MASRFAVWAASVLARYGLRVASVRGPAMVFRKEQRAGDTLVFDRRSHLRVAHHWAPRLHLTIIGLHQPVSSGVPVGTVHVSSNTDQFEQNRWQLIRHPVHVSQLETVAQAGQHTPSERRTSKLKRL